VVEHAIPTIDEVRAAQERIAGEVLRTPLVRLNVDDAPAEVYLKLESLQPVGSFKLRGATSAVRLIPEAEMEEGVWTVSAGNMAQGLSWAARRLGVKCTAVVPENAPEAKLANILRLGGSFVKASFEEFTAIWGTREYDGVEGRLVHPFSDPAVLAGNGTIALEILEDLPEVDTIVVAWGGGGLCSGIAAAIKAVRPQVKVYACEAETSSPLAAALAAGGPVRVDYTLSFVDGIGSPIVQPEMYALAIQLIDGSLLASLEETASAVKLMAERNHLIAEGAGGVSVAAVLAGRAGGGKVVCIVSGGNIDPAKLVTVLEGGVPPAG
jgi:threonine dehydratase